MKKLLGILAVSFFMTGMIACDVIEEPYKKDNGGGETPDPQAVVKHVLLEDYTGVRCVNCPQAGQLALEIQESNDHKVIVLSVHAGDLATYPPFNLKTPEGDEWWSFFNFQENPIGTINRKRVNGGYAYGSPSWTDAVAEALQEEAVVEMTSEIEYDEATRNLKVDVKSEFLAELPDTYSLTVCIMEDSIKGMQVTPQGNNPDYIHRHVFRTTMNGAWGEEINTEAIAPKDVITKEYTTTLNEAYNADQCYIIAYVANSETKEILQVVEKKIK